MPEQKIVPSITSLDVNGSTIKIRTTYNPDELPNILSIFIAENNGTLNGTPYKEGELIVTMKKYPEDINIFLNNLGELVIISDDAVKYAIDNNIGELQYTKD